MSLNSARCDPEYLRSLVGVEVKDHGHGNDLALPGRQPGQRRNEPRINGTVDVLDRRRVCSRPGIGHQEFATPPTPSGDAFQAATVKIHRHKHH
jgi:hypothetical protein